MIEAEFQDAFVKQMRSHGLAVHVLHGHMLMAGLPDLLILGHWRVIHCELKMWDFAKPPMCKDDFIKLLKGPQRAIIQRDWWERGNACFMVALNKRDNLTAYRCDGTNNIEIASWEYFARDFAHAVQD